MSFTEDVIEELKKLGFNEYQAKVYTALVGLGVATASEISQASGVPPNKVYSVIDTLKKRGLVLAQESDTSTNRYRPRSPDSFMKMIMDATNDICIGIDSPFDLHLHGIDQVLNEASGHLKSITIITGEDGIDNPSEVNVLKSLSEYTDVRVSENFHAIWVIIDSLEILQGTYAQLEGGIELGVMATWSDNKSFAELWKRFSDSLWENATPLEKIKLPSE
ncbi:MAG: TrmB family transcriptional regulator [Candidatus Heimdallarchaeota archaeon]